MLMAIQKQLGRQTAIGPVHRRDLIAIDKGADGPHCSSRAMLLSVDAVRGHQVERRKPPSLGSEFGELASMPAPTTRANVTHRIGTSSLTGGSPKLVGVEQRILGRLRRDSGVARASTASAIASQGGRRHSHANRPTIDSTLTALSEFMTSWRSNARVI